MHRCPNCQTLIRTPRCEPELPAIPRVLSIAIATAANLALAALVLTLMGV